MRKSSDSLNQEKKDSFVTVSEGDREKLNELDQRRKINLIQILISDEFLQEPWLMVMVG